MEEKIKKLEELYNTELSLYKKVYIQAAISKMKLRPKELEKKERNVELIPENKVTRENGSRCIVQICDNKIIHEWKDLKAFAQELNINYNTAISFFHNKNQQNKFNIMRKRDYLENGEEV